jgi:N6-adenosine-specific RNA methylase IME4
MGASVSEVIAGFEVHPAASAFPLMPEQELAELADSIRGNGLKHPIVVQDRLVIDGRNRLVACERAGVRPSTVEWDGRGSVLDYVINANLHRRHLTQDQRAVIAKRMLHLYTEESKQRQLAQLKNAPKSVVSALGARTKKGKATEVAADAFKVGARTVERAKFVGTKAPELEEKVLAGEMTLKKAEKQIRKAEQVERVKAYAMPAGKFGVIVADPPWQYDDELAGSDNARGGLPYPSMTLTEICDMDVVSRADVDCVLWLWVTNAHLLDGSAHQVLKAWGFEPKTMLTWDKVNMGAGRWLRGVTEHVILAIRGSPTITLGNQTTLIRAKRREHSRKPDEFYALVERLCVSPSRLELFAREPRKGWTTSGAEARLFAEENRSSEDQMILRGSKPIDRGDLCGVYDGKKGDACFHKLGHEGVHSNGYRTWTNKSAKPKAPRGKR